MWHGCDLNGAPMLEFLAHPFARTRIAARATSATVPRPNEKDSGFGETEDVT
jgi:hypothetical protein